MRRIGTYIALSAATTARSDRSGEWAVVRAAAAGFLSLRELTQPRSRKPD